MIELLIIAATIAWVVMILAARVKQCNFFRMHDRRGQQSSASCENSTIFCTSSEDCAHCKAHVRNEYSGPERRRTFRIESKSTISRT